MREATREEILRELAVVMRTKFEVVDPDPDSDLRETHGFDSIDAIELLVFIEDYLGSQLTQDEKQQAMEIRTLNQICDYMLSLIRSRSQG
jgi:acyl carrier protein